MTQAASPTSALVVCKRLEATGVVSLEFRPEDSQSLKKLTPGAHIDLHFPDGMMRQYSVVRWNDSSFTIAVKQELASRGGSKYLVDVLQVGQHVRIDEIRNSFPLAPGSHVTVMIAGGIGITPFISMVEHLSESGSNWALYYAARSPEAAAFNNHLRQHRPRVHFSYEHGRRFDLAEIISAHGRSAHFYACGPTSLLEAFRLGSQDLPSKHVHMEHFGPTAPRKGDGEFVVQLAKSGRSIRVTGDQTILQALSINGIDVPHSCEQGICGQCEMGVLGGVPDHRDDVLDAVEKSSNRTMMICCSRAHSPVLVLDY